MKIGDKFDTDAEMGCIVVTLPNPDAWDKTEFIALDSDGVECMFVTGMIVALYPQ